MKMDYLYKHVNGNYVFKVFDNNIRVRETKNNEQELKPEYPEIHHIIINDYNYNGYIINSDFFNFSFINEILNFTEINIYGSDIFEHPQLEDIIQFFKDKRCYIKLYINQNQLIPKNIKIIEKFYENKLIKELHININKINKRLIQYINNKKFIYLEIMSHLFNLNQLSKLKTYNIIIKNCNNIFNKKQLNNKKNIKNNIINIINNFDCIEFDYSSILLFNLKEYLPKDYNISFNNLFSISFNLPNNTYSKSLNSNTFFNINDNLKNMFKNLQNS